MNKTGLEKMVEWLEGKIDLDTYDSDIAKTHLLKARQLLASEATAEEGLIGDLDHYLKQLYTGERAGDDVCEIGNEIKEVISRYRPVVKEQGEAWSCKTCANKGIKCQECVKTTMCGTPAFYKEQGEAGLDRHGRVVTAEALSDALSSPAPVASQGLVEELRKRVEYMLQMIGETNLLNRRTLFQDLLHKQLDIIESLSRPTTNQDEKGGE
jgi:hypothetical protein